MELKSYFCPRCGRGFNQSDCIATDDKLQCVFCKDTSLAIAGWPFILLGMFVGIASWLARAGGLQIHGEFWIFLPAAFGLFLIGVIRMIQMHYRRKHPRSRLAQDEINETEALDDPNATPPADESSAS